MQFMGQFHEHNHQIKLDLTDKKILYLLSLNARFSESSIAKSLNLSKEVVHYRIKGLQKKEFLHGFITIVDSEKLGHMVHSINVLLHPSSNQKELLDYLLEEKRVNQIKHLNSLLNLQFGITTTTIREFMEFFDTFVNKYHASIKDYAISTILEDDFMGLDFLVEDLKEKPTISEHKGSSFQNLFSEKKKVLVKIDAKDKEILHHLKLNCHIPLVLLAQKVQLATTSIQKRLADLIEQKVIKHFIPYASFSYLGYQWYTLHLRTKNIDENSFKHYLRQEPKIVWLSKCLGKWNYQLSIFAENNTQFNEVVQHLQQQFHDSIIAYETSAILKQYKFTPRVI
ncbi:Lrp/AsnC family transcriptional regulator [Candidatus Woesearchaeota archaeon]|nr:Lrp/AsnC family transcriptional regulator [Candidatus Woesearchaeota archaeon]